MQEALQLHGLLRECEMPRMNPRTCMLHATQSSKGVRFSEIGRKFLPNAVLNLVHEAQ